MTCATHPRDYLFGAEINHILFMMAPVESWTSRLSIEPHWQLMEKVPLWNMTVPPMDEESGKTKKRKEKRNMWHRTINRAKKKPFSLLRRMGSQHLEMTGSGVESLLLLCSLKSKMSAKGFGHFSIRSSKLLAWQGSANQRDEAGVTRIKTMIAAVNRAVDASSCPRTSQVECQLLWEWKHLTPPWLKKGS